VCSTKVGHAVTHLLWELLSTSWPARLGRADDHSGFVNPHHIRDVDHAKKRVHLVRWIEQGRVFR